MNVYDYSNKGVYIATSSTCLTTPLGGQGGQGATGDLWKQGLVSEDGFLLIKSMEAFSPTPYNIGDGTNTIGYGTTSKYDTDKFIEFENEENASYCHRCGVNIKTDDAKRRHRRSGAAEREFSWFW